MAVPIATSKTDIAVRAAGQSPPTSQGVGYSDCVHGVAASLSCWSGEAAALHDLSWWQPALFV